MNGTKLRELGVPLLPLDEQKELWLRIFNAIEQVAREVSRVEELLDRLDQATLARAFHGGLVPSDQGLSGN